MVMDEMRGDKNVTSRSTFDLVVAVCFTERKQRACTVRPPHTSLWPGAAPELDTPAVAGSP